MLAGFLLGSRHHGNGRGSKPVLFIVANFCHFAKNKMAQQHQQWIILVTYM
jgi:hypothetical protein